MVAWLHTTFVPLCQSLFIYLTFIMPGYDSCTEVDVLTPLRMASQVTVFGIGRPPPF